jgi:hypothetical protein
MFRKRTESSNSKNIFRTLREKAAGCQIPVRLILDPRDNGNETKITEEEQNRDRMNGFVMNIH